MSDLVLIVGEAPGAQRRLGVTRVRIERLADRPLEEWAVWRNLLDRWPGQSRKGSAWDARTATTAAWILASEILPTRPGDDDPRHHHRIVLLGRRVEAAFTRERLDWFEWRTHCVDDDPGRELYRYAVSPHTSGIVRWWNDPANVERARVFYSDLARSYALPSCETADAASL